MTQIVNDHQLQVSRDWLARFTGAALDWEQSPCPPEVDPIIWQAQGQSLWSTVEELQREIEAYEGPRGGIIEI